MAWTPCRVSYRHELNSAISEIFPAQWFSQFSSHGNSDWTPQKIFWGSILMSWQPQETLGEQFQSARDVLRDVFPRWTLGRSSSGFFDARQRLMDEMQGPLVRRLKSLVSQYFEDWRVRGWMLFSVDGSRFETCRSKANEQVLGCAGKESTTPQVFQTTLLHVGTGLPWDFRLGPGTDSERRHLEEMLDSLPEKSMLTADAGFISFNLCRWLMKLSYSFVLRVGSNMHLLTKLGWDVEREGKTVYLWPKKQRHLPPVVLRLIVVREPGRQAVYLVTNIFDEDLLSDADAAEIYRLRWGQELYYRSFKQTLGHKTLRSRTPQMSLVEQTWHVIAMWLLQLLTAQELMAAGKAPTSWSAAKARAAIRRLMTRALTERSCSTEQTFRRKLQAATIDGYNRAGPKQIRHWPRKKQDKPPGPPKIHLATDGERQQAQRLRDAKVARL
jgi:IS4 transposase